LSKSFADDGASVVLASDADSAAKLLNSAFFFRPKDTPQLLARLASVLLAVKGTPALAGPALVVMEVVTNGDVRGI
jgi:hypothetical protein